jgi:hypothetical protein
MDEAGLTSTSLRAAGSPLTDVDRKLGGGADYPLCAAT